MKFLLAIIISFISVCSYAQTDTIFLTDYWRVCDKEYAAYYRVYEKSKKIYLIDDYYINGQLYMKTVSTSYNRLNRQGETVFYFENGNKKSSGNYTNNKQEGEWKEWYDNDTLESVGKYEKDKKIGLWKTFYKNGSIFQEGSYITGKKTGIWKEWYKNKQLKSEGKYNSYKQIGDWKGYHENGYVMYEQFYNDEGKLDGTAKYWHDNGQLSSEKLFVNGEIVKGGKSYHENGAVNLVYNYDSNGMKVGAWIQYFPNGKIRIKGKFKSNEKEEVWIENDEETGEILIKGEYKEGIKKGTWDYYSNEGKLLALINYKDGEITEQKYSNEKGRKVKLNEANKNPNFFSSENHNLTEQINLNFNLSNDKIVAGNTIISLNIAAEGTILKVYSPESINPVIDSALVEAFRSLNKFESGKKYNRNIKYYCDFEIKLNKNNTIDITGEHYITSIYSDIDFENYNYDDAVFTIVEKMPEFPGGIKEMMAFLSSNVKYPYAAKANAISGRVYVNFEVRRTGIVSNVRILRGVHKLLDDEALRVVREFPKWTPGFQRGIPVTVSYNIPINFVLK